METLVVETRRVELTVDELELVRTALRLLLATLGKDEAAEIREIEAILEKL